MTCLRIVLFCFGIRRDEIIPAKHPNSDIFKIFLEIIGWEDSGRILSGFYTDSKDSGGILQGFWEASGGFWKDSDDSGRILEGFCQDSIRILRILKGF